MRRLIISLLASLLILLPSLACAWGVTTMSGGVAAGGTPSSQIGYTTSDNDKLVLRSTTLDFSTYYYAQSFTTVGAITVTSIKLKLSLTGTPVGGSFYVYIYSDNGSDDPDALVTNATASRTVTDIVSAGAGWQEWTFATAPSLSATTVYHIIIEGTGQTTYDNSNRVEWRVNTSGAYDGGNVEYKSSIASGGWSEYAYDAMFDVWGY